MTDIERLPKEVIEKQLLVALDDKSKVALVLDEEDLTLLLVCLMLSENSLPSPTERKRVKGLRRDVQKLLKEAFNA